MVLSITHEAYGDPAMVLTVTDGQKVPAIDPTQVEVRVTYAPIHPGDLLGVEGSPAAGTASAISDAGRTPGFEGCGVISRIGSSVDPKLGLSVGDRVAFFPAKGAWSEFVMVAPTSIVRLPDDMSDEVGAHILINTITAISVLRTAEGVLPSSGEPLARVLQTGAASAVGRLVTVLCLERNISPLRLVRSSQSADGLRRSLPGTPVFATEEAGWKEKVLREAGENPIRVALDGVGGPLLADLASLLADGDGTIINYGSLGGQNTDIRLFPPRALTLRGVSIGQWPGQSPATKQGDVDTAVRLGRHSPDLFDVAGRYVPTEFAAAVAHVRRPGKAGTVLLSF